MMQGVDELKSILNCMAQDSGDGELLLQEKEESGTLKNVTLTGLDVSGMTLKGDKANIKIFKKDCASCVCDYIVLTTIQEKNYAFFIELKSTVPLTDHNAKHPTVQPNGKYEHYVLQLSGGDCLFSYFDHVLEMFLDCKALRDYRRKYVVLYKSPGPAIAMPIHPTRTPISNFPANPTTKAKLLQVANGSTISLDDLL